MSEHRQEGVKISLMCTLPMQMRVCGCNLVLVRLNVLLITTPVHHSTNDQDHKSACHQTASFTSLIAVSDPSLWSLSPREDRSVINILLSLDSTAARLALTDPLNYMLGLCSQTHVTPHTDTLQLIHRPRSHKHACCMCMNSVTRHKHWF